MFDFKGNIEKVREIYRTSRPKPADRVVQPGWMSSFDSLCQVINMQKTLYESGNIYYGSLVQANSLLFKRFSLMNCPADIVYSTDPYFDGNPQELAAIARELFKYKNTSNAPADIKYIVNAITDEMKRLFNIALPDSVTGGRKVFFTVIMVFRKHLPKGHLIGSIFPVIAKPETLPVSMIVPKAYWTEPLTQYYCQR